MALQQNPATLARRGVLARRWHVDVELIRTVVAAANRVGVELNGWQAEHIADELMGYHQGEYALAENVYPELWDTNESLRTHVRANMRRTLAMQLMEQDLIPCSTPHETIDRFNDVQFSSHVRIVLRVKVRPAPKFSFKVKRHGETRFVS